MQLGTRTAIAFPLVLLGLTALITFWIDYSVQPEKPKADGSSRHDPDYIMHNFETTQTDIQGALRYKLAAIEMRHFPDDDTTELQQPHYTQFAVNKPYTRVVGKRGFVSSDGEEVRLVDNVVVTRQAFADKGEMTVETDYLNIRPNEELVTTDRPVIIRQAPKTVIYATGMIYEKKTKTVTLLNKVRAHYERPVPVRPSTPVANTAQTAQKSAPQVNANKTQPNTKNGRIRRSYE